MKPRRPAPASNEEWLAESAEAYIDAAEAIPFGPVSGITISEHELFHLAPSVCLKFRGLRGTGKLLKKATDAALSTFVASQDVPNSIVNNPRMAFTLCYIASHYGLGLIGETEANAVIQYIEEHAGNLSNGCSPDEAQRNPEEAAPDPTRSPDSDSTPSGHKRISAATR